MSLGLVQRADVLGAVRGGAATATFRRRRVEDCAQSPSVLGVLVDDLLHLGDIFLARRDVECVAFLVHNEIDFNDLHGHAGLVPPLGLFVDTSALHSRSP